MTPIAEQSKVDTRPVDNSRLIKLLQEDAMRLPDTGICISGISGRFPKCGSINDLEENLLKGADLCDEPDDKRWRAGILGLPRRAGRIQSVDEFDNEFFGFSSAQANWVDHQLRILYETVHESILDAGLSRNSIAGPKTGLFMGLCGSEFDNYMVHQSDSISSGPIGEIAIKVAQYYQVQGIVSSFDTACASGFTAFAEAVASIRAGVLDQAIVCAVNIPINPTMAYAFLDLQMVGKEGYTYFLDSRASGYVKAEACVSMIVQRKHAALRNYCSVMATAMSVDGFKTEGITFPSDTSQEDLIAHTKKLAGISTNHVEYIEAHGTGTPAGDPQEAAAIARVYYPKRIELKAGKAEDDRLIGPLHICSIKTNMGHSEAGSGLCALAKVLLMLEHEVMYKGLHYERPNQMIKSVIDGRLVFVREIRELTGKIIPISCYGFGGANVHAIVRASHRPAIDIDENPGLNDEVPRLVCMFGRTRDAVAEFLDKMLDSNSRGTRNCLHDDFLLLLNNINAQPIERLMSYRGFMVVDRRAKPPVELKREVRECRLERATSDCDDIGKPAHWNEARQRPVHLIFPGIGSEWLGMAAGLRGFEPFWSTIERLAAILEPFADEVDLIETLTSTDPAALRTTSQRFVAVVAYEIALVHLAQQRLRVQRLAGVAGHSVGELACAHAAGLLDEREAVLAALCLGRVLDRNAARLRGKMLAVGVSAAEAQGLIAGLDSVAVSCVNGPRSVTLSGGEADVERLRARLQQRQLSARELDVPLALHNPKLMDAEVRRQLEEALGRVLSPGGDYGRQAARWPASFAGGRDMSQANAAYFADNLCLPVDFLSALKQLAPDAIALELGPSGIFEMQLAAVEAAPGIPRFHHASLSGDRRYADSDQQIVHLLSSIGRLYQTGATLDLNHFYYGEDLKAKRDELLPVRRQTPSISSLIKWKHEEEFFVPRISERVSLALFTPSIKIADERDKYLTGHNIDGRVIFPATGYLFLMWRHFSAKQSANTSCANPLVPIEFRNIKFLGATMLAEEGNKLILHNDETTGFVQVLDGETVVIEGYMSSPTENPEGLLYDDNRNIIRPQRQVLNKDDIYKMLRLNGYDYSGTFQGITSASADGSHCKVKHQGYLVALLDCIVQTMIVSANLHTSVNHRAKESKGALLLPTSIEYCRLQPELIHNKLRRDGVEIFEKTLVSTTTKEDEATMERVLKRQAGEASNVGTHEETVLTDANFQTSESVFDTYYDIDTGIIISDGIEFRNVGVTPAPRRVDGGDVLLESYQYVPDLEDPVIDEPLTKYEKKIRPYVQACDSMSAKVLKQACKVPNSIPIAPRGINRSPESLETYLDASLRVRFNSTCNNKSPTGVSLEMQADQGGESDANHDITKNGDHVLLSILDRLVTCEASQAIVRSVMEEHKLQLMDDLVQRPYTSERYLRPLIETIIENVCADTMDLKMMEVNMGDGLLVRPLQNLARNIESSLNIDYHLAHPDAERLIDNGSLLDDQVSTHQLINLTEFIGGSELGESDAVIYKDSSCYSLPNPSIARDELASVMSSLKATVRLNGFLLIALRDKFTFAEKVLQSISRPELIGLKESDIADSCQNRSQLIIERLELADKVMQDRYESAIKEAELNGLALIAQKRDPNGCNLLLFRNHDCSNRRALAAGEMSNNHRDLQLIRVTHGNLEQVSEWLGELKSRFVNSIEHEAEEASAQQKSKQKIVWLCAVASRENPINGLIGMMQALRKELGSARLRCFYDMHTSRHRREPVSVADIERSAHFAEARRRDLLWYCVDEAGRLGAFRHFAINDTLLYEDCICDRTQKELDLLTSRQTETNSGEISKLKPVAALASVATRGDLSSITWFEAPIKYLSLEDEARICKIAFSSMNFRDVMLASGKLPQNAITLQLALQDCQIGSEFSGLLSDGRRIAGMVLNKALATHVLYDKTFHLIFEVPETMSLREAATIPVVYATVLMALKQRTRIHRGETILIHAGSGGVGQAAIRLASWYGLEIYTTVGSDEKRRFLLEEFGQHLTDDRIFSSRSCDFEHQILAATKGRGVDIVLNSLADDKLQASINCLADGGRFLEIGKYDLVIDKQLELTKLNTDKTFHGVHLDKLFDLDKPEINRKKLDELQDMLTEGIKIGYVKPIKHKVFSKSQIEEACRYMAGGKHIGKIIIEIDADLDELKGYMSHDQLADIMKPSLPLKCVPRSQFKPNVTYIVTGGLGGFGLELTKWLVQRGARYIVLTSRMGARTGYQKTTLRILEDQYKAKILVSNNLIADTTTYDGASELCSLASEMSPIGQIGGIFHLSMVLRDKLLENMNSGDFELVCKPKVDVCIHLDQLTGRDSEYPVDYFVVFSSISCGKGNAGQANYAYANSCIERIVERRRRDGLHGLAVQWGPIGDVGVAFENLGGNDVLLGGMRPQRMPSCLTILEKLLSSPYTTVLSALPIQGSSMKDGKGGGPSGRGGSDSLSAIFHVLGIRDPSSIDENTNLGDLGLDSLMAVEIRQYIKREYEVSMTMREIRSLTIGSLKKLSMSNTQTNGVVEKKAAEDIKELDGSKSEIEKIDESQTSERKLVHDFDASKIEADSMTEDKRQEAEQLARLQKSLKPGFLPKLELAEQTFSWLNFKSDLPRASIKLERPIFFIGPTNSSLEDFEAICARITRPCIAIHWTYELNKMTSIDQVAASLADSIKNADWSEKFSCGSDGDSRVVDIVGYSLGATLAFEIMMSIHNSHQLSLRGVFNRLVPREKIAGYLKPGRLILLEGAPTRTVLDNPYFSLHENNMDKVSARASTDDLLMVFIMAHTRNYAIDYLKIKTHLATVEPSDKMLVACELLDNIIVGNDPGCSVVPESGDGPRRIGEQTKPDRIKLARAMEAFCVEQKLLQTYKLRGKLPMGCTMIRSGRELSHGQQDNTRVDLLMSHAVKGKVSLYVVHEGQKSFLLDNPTEIADIVVKSCQV